MIPATAPRAPLRVKERRTIRSTGIPLSAAVLRLAATARMALPVRVPAQEVVQADHGR